MPVTFTISIHVNAPPEHVFAVITDLDNAPKWMSSVVSIDRKTEGPYGVGTQWTETRKMFGRPATELFEVTDLVPNSRVSVYVDGSKGSSRKGEYRFTHTVEKDGAGTKVTIAGEIDVPGRLAELLGRFLVWFMARTVRKDLASMKAYAEGTTL